jgi:four helix bundle protein
MHDFRKLRVWRDAKDYCIDVYRVTRGFPRDELFGFTSQMRRASRSIAANIAEGCGYDGGNTPRFFRTANGSASESLSDLIITHELGLLSDADYLALGEQRLVPVCKQLWRLIQMSESRYGRQRR